MGQTKIKASYSLRKSQVSLIGDLISHSKRSEGNMPSQNEKKKEIEQKRDLTDSVCVPQICVGYL